MNKQEVDNFNREIGLRIKKYRTVRGLSQEELAGRAGLSTVTISNVENAVNGTSIFNLLKIAEALDVLVTKLIFGELDGNGEQLHEIFMKAAKLDDAKKDLITNIVNQIIKGVEKIEK